MPENFTHPKAVTGVPVVVARKTGFYVSLPDGALYADPAGHSWFGKSVACVIAFELGATYLEGGHGSIKQVVTGYLPPAPEPASAPPAVTEQLSLFDTAEARGQGGLFDMTPVPLPLDGCTCGGVGNTGAHRRDCPWGAR